MVVQVKAALEVIFPGNSQGKAWNREAFKQAERCGFAIRSSPRTGPEGRRDWGKFWFKSLLITPYGDGTFS
jgi:hypothetical protein